MSTPKPIPTWYAGCYFRSRLEARWAVFFDRMQIPWQYEPQGFLIDRVGGGETPYLPDFLLPECGTWIEVKGYEAGLDLDLLGDAEPQLPRHHDGGELGPSLLVLGPIPRPGRSAWRGWEYDWGWPAVTSALTADDFASIADKGWPTDWGAPRNWALNQSYWGFGEYHKNRRPWYLDNATNDAYHHDPVTYALPADRWLTPVADTSEVIAAGAYTAARSARFEHGDRGSAA